MVFSALSIDAPRSNPVDIGVTGPSVVVPGIVPPGAVLVGLSVEVITAIAGATGFDVGDGSDQDRWGANIPVALNAVSDATDWTIGTIEAFPSGAGVTLTALGGNFTAGTVRVTAYYVTSI